MAYAPKDLSVLVYANGFTLWHYTTQHNLTQVDEPGYFDGVSDALRIADPLLQRRAAIALGLQAG
ncbi:hypothetical protein [Azospirillum brasilense]|uniref:hypothetical protein n=1 Tax=Azospirillum brasilense TaxID=192 RepID=UPI000E679F0B|nr:hypothetical protein [Azospirillum brasilense]NUB24640.1 hypothetical protein [Azospirillum brasilense]NUB35181.1 hypothetical protein [Azospirillum brasilense]RIW07721.1 hypothetical protein D2T81_02465 [Azospirillum brasilense]